MKRIIAAFVIVLLLVAVAKCFPYIVVDEEELAGAVILSLDSQDEQSPRCLIGQDKKVWFWANGKKILLIDDLPGKVTALAIDDLEGDFPRSLVIGTNEENALYFYRLKNGQWMQEGSFRELTDPVVFIGVHDFNQDGQADLVIRSSGGQAQVLLSWEDKLYPFWKSVPHEFTAHLEIADINNDNFPEIIYTYKSGYIAVLTWDDQQFVTLWENYPWGLIESLVVINEGDYPEWLVVTSQKMVYGWRWKNEEIVASRHFYGLDLGDRVFYLPQGLLSFSEKTGISLFDLGSSSVTERWNIPELYGVQAFDWNQGYLVKDRQNNFFRLAPGNQQWKVFINDQDVTELLEVFQEGSTLYFNLKQLGEQLGFSVFGLKSWHLLKKGRYLKTEVGSRLVELNDLPVPLGNEILEINGLPFVPSELLPLLGWTMEMDRARQKLMLLENWGWWF